MSFAEQPDPQKIRALGHSASNAVPAYDRDVSGLPFDLPPRKRKLDWSIIVGVVSILITLAIFGLVDNSLSRAAGERRKAAQDHLIQVITQNVLNGVVPRFHEIEAMISSVGFERGVREKIFEGPNVVLDGVVMRIFQIDSNLLPVEKKNQIRVALRQIRDEEPVRSKPSCPYPGTSEHIADAVVSTGVLVLAVWLAAGALAFIASRVKAIIALSQNSPRLSGLQFLGRWIVILVIIAGAAPVLILLVRFVSAVSRSF